MDLVGWLWWLRSYWEKTDASKAEKTVARDFEVQKRQVVTLTRCALLHKSHWMHPLAGIWLVGQGLAAICCGPGPDPGQHYMRLNMQGNRS
jgi:hypothetical protein